MVANPDRWLSGVFVCGGDLYCRRHRHGDNIGLIMAMSPIVVLVVSWFTGLSGDDCSAPAYCNVMALVGAWFVMSPIGRLRFSPQPLPAEP
jgi:hypothetical protein